MAEDRDKGSRELKRYREINRCHVQIYQKNSGHLILSVLYVYNVMLFYILQQFASNINSYRFIYQSISTDKLTYPPNPKKKHFAWHLGLGPSVRHSHSFPVLSCQTRVVLVVRPCLAPRQSALRRNRAGIQPRQCGLAWARAGAVNGCGESSSADLACRSGAPRGIDPGDSWQRSHRSTPPPSRHPSPSTTDDV